MRIGDINDIADWHDARSLREQITPHVLARIHDDNVRPTGVQIVDYPKDVINVRPLARFTIDDHLIYSTLVFQIARSIDNTIGRAVHSYRWLWNDNGFRAPVRSWIRMQRRCRSLLKKDGTLKLAKTDISSFYEGVDLDTLVDDIDYLDIGNYNPGRLRGFLDGFQEAHHAWGLPQGLDASGLLANLYLTPVDEYLRRRKLQYFRYSDDIDIFSRDWEELREAISDINKILRAKRLSMSAAKTRIYEPDEALRKFDDTEKEALQYNIDIGSTSSPDEVKAFFIKASEADPLSARDIRWSLRRLGQFGVDYAIGWAFDNLVRSPHLARTIFDYLHYFPSETGKISRHLSKLAKDTSWLNPHLKKEIFRYFLTAQIDDRAIRELAWLALDDQNTETFVREFATRYIGRTSKFGDGPRIKHAYESESNLYMRRALLIAMYESRYCPTRMLSGLTKESTLLRWTASYLLQEPKVPLPKESL
ncbi:RNA-directed DNA polymerase [Lentzea sp. NBRC 102530]|uniref:RNA-directed DNA polymerase n=1 Tax=Lentzea sp. NBRC 102530 TaxID=3032201 RepID=UPI0024A026A8|nr:RNA-directed DNA polymerase [Lentzea sp. NBRC 102530]GLY51891.1 hypothetical protein Lesp01_55470 [Lentzea sp. NBRC 102530]